MNLTKLFETQDQLDDRIIKEKGLQGQDLLDKKILALQVELGELANEWRGFKFWSEDQEPRDTGYIDCDVCIDQPGRHEIICENEIISAPCPKCEGYAEVYVGDRLLEEYVDNFHFILSIGNDLNLYKYECVELIDLTGDITAQFNAVFQLIGNWKKESLLMNNYFYFEVVNEFLCLGKMLGFTWEQIEQAYYEKNEINHTRQENGY